MSPSACSPTLSPLLACAPAALAAVALTIACEPRDPPGLAGTSGDEPVSTDTTDPLAPTTPTTGEPACDDDVWEPNPDAERASEVEWESADAWTAWRALDDLHLCAGDEDWYAFDVARLGYTVHAVYIRALVAGAGLCGADCGETVIPAGPRHAMTLEVHRGDASGLLMSQTADDGVLVLDGWGDDFAGGLRIRVFSPTASASYPYRLTVNIRKYEGEDECEC
jgi:hypothetical protein